MSEGRGVVFLVGAGPGDPGLITVRGRELLDTADAIVHDALASRRLLPADARDTGLPELYNVGKRGGAKRSVSQDEINALLVKLAREGKRVVRLKGGDPFVFGRGGEEAQALNDSGVPFEVVPGITAGVAAPAYAGIPVTHRGLGTSVTFVTGHEDPAKATTQTSWSALAQAGGTIVIYMGAGTLPAIVQALLDGGMAPEVPAAVVQWGTTARQRTITATLATLAEEVRFSGISAPMVTVIGWPVVLRDELAWFESRPLFGRRIVVTRATDRAPALSTRLTELGAEVLEMPATRIVRLDLQPLKGAIANLTDFDWLLLTSAAAVRIFWEQLLGAGRDSRALAGLRIGAVGPATAASLLERGIVVDVVPERFVAEGLLERMTAEYELAGARILYVSAEGARDVLPDGLMQAGAEVTVMPAYRSVPDGTGAARLTREIESGTVNAVTFTSGAGVRAYVDALGAEVAARVPAASIGPVTTQAIADAGLQLLCEAEEATIDSLVDTVKAALE